MIDTYVPEVFDADAVARLRAAGDAALTASRGLAGDRSRDGFVRHCHGDLHLRNIFLDNGVPHLFDAIEFDDRLARIDVHYDLAFLLMDLWHRDLRDVANRVLGRYLLRTGDFAGLALMPLYLSLRAGIRAHVAATTAGSASEPQLLLAEARQYLALADDLLVPRPPVLIGVGGVSGTGKSTFAAALAPHLGPVPGAVCLRSDELRKIMLGAEPEQPLGPEGYTSDVSDRVYFELRNRSAVALRSGAAAIADAVHGHAESRAELEAVADRAGVPFVGFWLDAPVELLERRLETRRGDASDADAAVMHDQLISDMGQIAWHRLPAGQPIAGLVDAALDVIGSVLPVQRSA
jgi:predicted kinase